MDEYGIYDKFMVRDYCSKYCYLLEGRGRIFYFFYYKLNTFAEAYSFHRENQIIVIMYIITVPIAMIIEYIMEEAGAIKIEDFNLKSIFRIYIIAFTFVAALCLQSFSRSFSGILPFENFENEISSMAIIKTFFDWSGSAIRLFSFDMTPIEAFDAYQLIFLATFATFLMIMTIFQYYVLNPHDFANRIEKTMIIDFTNYNKYHQFRKLSIINI